MQNGNYVTLRVPGETFRKIYGDVLFYEYISNYNHIDIDLTH